VGTTGGVKLAAALAALAALALAAPAGAVTLEPIGSATYDTPTYVASDPSNPDRLFVTEQAGRIDLTTPAGTSRFLDLADKVLDGGERGLWSIAFAPDHATSRLFYVAYSANDGALTLDEYRAEASPAATEATRRRVLSIPNDFGTHNHNGGQLQFGPDGYLYWSTGEDAHAENAQNPATRLGAILRIDPHGANEGEFTVPGDNPFVGGSAGDDPVWSHGLRNPWRFSFDRQTGALTIGDVGAGSREEVDFMAQPSAGRGSNFGWPRCEGTSQIGPTPCAAFALPLYEYDQTPGASNCGIVGGYVVRDPDLTELVGRYLFTDLCGGDLRSIDPAAPPPFDQHRTEGVTVDGPVSFGEDSCGRLYIVSQQLDRVFRVEGASGGACSLSPGTPDSDPPQTRLQLMPRGKQQTKATFLISSDEPGSTFRCRLDKGRWKRCGKRRRLKGLDAGRHRFRAVATDVAGNKDPKPAGRRFRVEPLRG
jgi:glucose/arabinose dehydrogenase